MTSLSVVYYIFRLNKEASYLDLALGRAKSAGSGIRSKKTSDNDGQLAMLNWFGYGQVPKRWPSLEGDARATLVCLHNIGFLNLAPLALLWLFLLPPPPLL